ncbi:MAG: ComF family protein [Firmicutes bacterium]|nr:ComF family protein [Bacillota bacterium]
MELLAPLLDLLFPPRCAICRGRLDGQLQGVAICSTCQELVLDLSHCCKKCGYPLPQAADVSCHFCGNRSYAFAGACAVSLYQGNIRKAIHRFKYGGRKELAAVFGPLLARQVQLRDWGPMDVLVPVPLHQQKLLERGYDQALLLAQAMGRTLKVPVKRLLTRTLHTQSQTALHASQRWENVADIFAPATNEHLPHRILLVDDLLTTGATAHFAATALRSAGAQDVYLAVIARS